MKKMFILFLFLAFVNPVFADIQPPQWSEFCPYEYQNASNQHNPASYILRYTRANNKEADYWYSRRNDFQNQLAQALQLPVQERANYYQQMRIIELNKNNAHYQNRQNYIARQGLMLQGFNTIQTMWTNSELHGINSGVNGINNSLNGIRYGY